MPYTKEQVRVEIADLAAHFRANEPSLADVPEAQIEGNYIRKLFRFGPPRGRGWGSKCGTFSEQQPHRVKRLQFRVRD
jgi:hypothetical protein